MRPERARLSELLVAAWDLLRLELRVVTGNRALVLGVVELAYFVALAAWARLRDERPDTATLYPLGAVVPGLVPAVALGMACVMGDRDTRQLEVTFATPGGRYQVWGFRLAAIVLACLASTSGLSVLTTLVVDHEHRALAAALHAAVPVTLTVALTACLSVLFNGASVGALLATTVVGLCVFFHAVPPMRRFDLFLNPFDEPTDVVDPAAWFRIVVFNRCLLLTGAALLVAFFLWLVQRRERLL